MRGGPPQHVADVLDEAKAIAQRELGATDEGTRPWGYTPAASDEPKPNSPEDVGFNAQPSEFTNSQTSKPALHEPRACRHCNAPVFWAALLDHRGQRIRRDDGKGWKSIPVDAAPSPEGTIVLFHREGEGVVARVLRDGEPPPPGAQRRRRHFDTCTNRADYRRSR